MHQDIDPDAARLLEAFSYRRQSLNFRRGIKQREERLDQYLVKDTVISIYELEHHGLTNRRGRAPLSPSERDRALVWLRDLIAHQA